MTPFYDLHTHVVISGVDYLYSFQINKKIIEKWIEIIQNLNFKPSGLITMKPPFTREVARVAFKRVPRDEERRAILNSWSKINEEMASEMNELQEILSKSIPPIQVIPAFYVYPWQEELDEIKMCLSKIEDQIGEIKVVKVYGIFPFSKEEFRNLLELLKEFNVRMVQIHTVSPKPVSETIVNCVEEFSKQYPNTFFYLVHSFVNQLKVNPSFINTLYSLSRIDNVIPDFSGIYPPVNHVKELINKGAKVVISSDFPYDFMANGHLAFQEFMRALDEEIIDTVVNHSQEIFQKLI